MYINGVWMGGKRDRSVYNHATGEVVGTIPNGCVVETITAIDYAHQAWQTWSQTTAYERANYLQELRDLMLENEHELAEMKTMEMGKPIQESRGEVKYAASFLD